MPACNAIRRQGAEGLLVAILGSLTPDDAENLARMRGGSSSVGVAFVLQTRLLGQLGRRARPRTARRPPARLRAAGQVRMAGDRGPPRRRARRAVVVAGRAKAASPRSFAGMPAGGDVTGAPADPGDAA